MSLDVKLNDTALDVEAGQTIIVKARKCRGDPTMSARNITRSEFLRDGSCLAAGALLVNLATGAEEAVEAVAELFASGAEVALHN